MTEAALAAAIYQMDSFVLGRYMERDKDIKWLKPRDQHVWALRTMLVPKVRLLGWFPLPRHFVVVHGKLRKELGKEGSPQWVSAVQKVIETRRALFLGLPFFQGNTFEDYV